MTTDNIVMWAIRRRIVDWDCAKTQTSLGDLEDSKNQLREESCVSLEGEDTFLQFVFVRSKRQYP